MGRIQDRAWRRLPEEDRQAIAEYLVSLAP